MESSIREGFLKTRGLMFAVWVIAGGYVANSSLKLSGKHAHEADMYFVYFLCRLIVFLLVTIIVLASSIILVRRRDDRVSFDISGSQVTKKFRSRLQQMPFLVRYRNVMWSSLLIIFGCVAMITKAFKVRQNNLRS